MAIDPETILRRYLTAGDDADYAAMNRWLDERIVVHSPGGATSEGIDAHIASWAAAHAGLADLRHAIQELVAQEPFVAARIVVTGVHQGTFLGIPATGATICVDLALFAHVQRGGIDELWEIADTGRALQQLGMLSGQVLSPGA